MLGLGVKNDYYPFGMLIPNRNFSSPEYRYGFQGQEKDDEIKGNGNSLNYKYRMHDPRVGRFFAVDPLTAKYPYYSPYQFSGNRLIDMVELEGLEPTETPDREGQIGYGKDKDAEEDSLPTTEKWIAHMGEDGKTKEWITADNYNARIKSLVDKTITATGLIEDYAHNRVFENDAIKTEFEVLFTKAKARNVAYRHFLKTGTINTDDFNSPLFWFTGALSKISKLKKQQLA